MRIASIVGARPNFIKLAPVSKELRKSFEELLIHTGQHYNHEMDRIFFQELGIPEPDYHLGIGSGSHGYQTGEMLKGIESILLKENPDMVMVFGDTNTTLAGSLAASKLHIPIAHIEAGLRSFDPNMPEEVNRVLVDHCSNLLSCPTQTALDNLRMEGIVKGVHLTGDVMKDILEDCIRIADKNSSILVDLDISSKEYYLVTIHRAENTDDHRRLASIINALLDLENVLFPCHPRTEKCLRDRGLWEKVNEKIKVIKPVGYLDMLQLERNSLKILTDSGGVQKEAYMLKIPCITMRDETEWVETVQDGWNILVGSNQKMISTMAREFVPAKAQRDMFGRGDASKNIVKSIKEYMDKGMA